VAPDSEGRINIKEVIMGWICSLGGETRNPENYGLEISWNDCIF
jgi:hypothetical protein